MSAVPAPTLRNAFDVEAVRRDFPILAKPVRGKKLVYLDSGASAQKPQIVVDTIRAVYEGGYANIHRGVHHYSQLATERFEAVRGKVARFLNAASPHEIVFTRNATEAINLVAESYGRTFFKAGDEVLVSEMEHHANIVPWQLLAERIGIAVKVVPIDDAGALDMAAYAKRLSGRVKLVALTHCSNVLGTVTPAAEIVRLAHAQGIPVLLDGSQAVVHLEVDVRALDVDFYVFTGHKLYGPSGTGVLYGKAALLEKMPPYQGGGDMIRHVSFAGTTFREPPFRFEAGTPAIAEVIGLGAAIDYVQSLGRDRIAAWESELRDYAIGRLREIPGLTLYGNVAGKAAIHSFAMDCAHPHDIGTILDDDGVAIRAGHHCAEPLMERLNVPATARASLALYNTFEEIDALADALLRVRKLFA
jgi:cysteine desulfurase/selenocysteine lyase